ncbi:MAG: TetR/AcrR family transcriptional regulator [Pseudomonadota bacterium]
MSKTTERRAKLAATLVDAARARIAASGVHHLRARDLAQDVGCSVGAIYNVFDDLDALILQVSLGTLRDIDKTMAAVGAQAVQNEDKPVETMIALANAYFQFVQENTNLWRALFDHDIPEDYVLPEPVRAEQNALFRHIEKPLSLCMRSAPEEQLSAVAKSLFSAVHGLITLSVEQRIAGVSVKEVKPQMDFLLRTFVAGLGAEKE